MTPAGYHPLDRALASAAAASQAGRWHEAIKLWRPWLGEPDVQQVAIACIAEAAIHAPHQGLADQMLAQLDPMPEFLRSLDADRRINEPDDPDRAAPAPDETLQDTDSLVTRFLADHPMGPALAALGRLEPLEPLHERRSLLSYIRSGPRAGRMSRKFRRLAARKGPAAVRGYIDRLLTSAARTYRSREIVHRMISTLRKVGYDWRDPVMRRALRRWGMIVRGSNVDVLWEARLQRVLHHRDYARALLRQAVERADTPRERREVKQNLAKIDHERSRWLDDVDILKARDFAPGPPRDIFRTLTEEGPTIAHGPGHTVELLESAFDYLLAKHARPTASDDEENRLLMVGNTLACGGMERVMANSYRHFADRGPFDAVDMALIDFEEGAESAYYADVAGVARDDVVLLDPDGEAPLPFALLPGSWKERCAKLYKHILDTRPRVIHAWNDLTGLLAAYAGLPAGCSTIIVHFHHGPSQPLSSMAEPVASYPSVYRRLVERRAIVPVFCSRASARAYREWWRLTEDIELRTIYNGFEWTGSDLDREAARVRAGVPQDASVIGWLGRFDPVKQPHLWAEAAVALAARTPKAHFLMVGDGPLRAGVSDVFTQAGLADRLHMPGQVSNVADYLAAMDLLWQSSASEGLPNALIEAQFAGLPVVAFDVGGVGETFIDGETGILVPPDDPAALASATAARLDDPDWLRRAGEGARAQAERRFSDDRFYAALSGLYSADSRSA